MPMKPFFNKTIISIICVVLLCFVVHVTTRSYYVVVHNEEMTSIKLEHQQSVSRAQTQHQNEIAGFEHQNSNCSKPANIKDKGIKSCT